MASEGPSSRLYASPSPLPVLAPLALPPLQAAAIREKTEPMLARSPDGAA